MQITIVNPSSRNPASFNEGLFSHSTLNTNSSFDYLKILIPFVTGSFCLLFGALILAGVVTGLPLLAASYFLSLGVTLVAGAGLCMVFRPPSFSIYQPRKSDLHISYY